MTLTPAPLLGREPELEVLAGALDAVEGGRSSAVGVLGEPGIGKSRLLEDLGRRAAARGHLVVEGRAAELERDVPFALWVEALDGAVGERGGELLADLDPQELGDLAVALPAVRRATGAAPAATVERHRVARAVRRLLAELATAAPVVVLLDDVHWADPASVDIISLLLHRPPRAATLVALSARSGRAPQVEAALQTAADHGAGVALELGPLPREAADALLPVSVRPAVRSRLYRDSGGNPFYLQALAGMDERAAAVGTPAPAGAGGVPRAVMAALAGEVAALAPQDRLLLQAAAVAGDPFDTAIAAAAAAMGDEEALVALDASLAADLVRPAGRGRRFRFRHPLVRRAVYETAAGGWKLAAHERAASALAGRGASAAERAHHVERAAHPGDLAAVELLALAAEQTQAAAPATAADWYATALRLLPDTVEHGDRRLGLLRGLGSALASAGRPREARDVLRQSLTLLPRAVTPERIELVVTLAQLEALWMQEPDAARRLMDAERAALGEIGVAASAAFNVAMALERAEQGDHPATRALADDARAAARAAGDRPMEALAAALAADAAQCALRGEDLDALAGVDARIAEAGRLTDALADDQVAEQLPMLLSLGIARLFTGAFDGAQAAAQRGVDVARATQQGLLAPAFVSLRGLAEQERGRLGAAEADQEEALDSALLSGNVQVAYWASIVFSSIALARGDVDLALSHGTKAWQLLGTRSYSQAGFTVADARLAAGDPQGALAALEAFGWVRPELWTLDRLKAVDVAVRVLLALGRVDEAQRWAGRAPIEGGGRRSGVFGAIAAHAGAAVLLAEDRPADAAGVALAGATRADDGQAPVWAGRCRVLAGEALAVQGRVEESRRELRRAATDLEACGALGYRDGAVRVLRRLGDRPRPAARPTRAPAAGDGPLAFLSPREREVAGLVGEGQTNGQIAGRLHLSESTVEKHVSSVLAKLGVRSRAGVVRLLAGEASSLR